ncbi:MAG: phosphoribosylformylglycinamidine cyclo-ligase, partial [Thiotrichales bacterium]|nr:phosphoribosylformylglycinamidine cyclo-ligase [Thiotrichales bacterium]
EMAGCSLVGGETAEMPGMYSNGDYDLAGFCVGVVEKSRLIDGSKIRDGDTIIALASSGPHANGYSLIRKLISENQVPLDEPLDNRPLIDHLLEPTTIYIDAVLGLTEHTDIRGIAHITGGGLLENIPRVLPAGVRAKIDTSSWQLPVVFRRLQDLGNIEYEEMFRTFNCGVGMVLIVDAESKQTVLDHLQQLAVTAWEIGCITTRDEQQSAVKLL